MVGRWLWILVCLAAVGIFIADYLTCAPQLPANVAKHFDIQGYAVAWEAKEGFLRDVWITAAILAVMCLAMLAAVCFAPLSLLSMPNAEYWRAPERAEETRRLMIDRVGWMTAATLLFSIGILDLMLRANLQAPPVFGNAFLLLGLYLAFLVLWLLEILWRCRVPKD